MNKSDWKPLAVVVLAAALVFCNSLGNGFVSDDLHTILRHPHIKDPSHVPQIFTSGHYEGKGGYRPLVTLSYALNYWAGGASPFGYHVINVLLHALNSALFFLICRVFFAAPFTALAAALLFAVHPAHGEAVAWTSGRAELLGALFFLSAWLAYLRNRSVMSLLFFVAALLCKENTLLLPAVLFLSDLHQRRVRDGWKKYILYVSVIAAYLVVRDSIYRFPLLRSVAKISFIDNPLVTGTLMERLCTATRILGDYVLAMFWPFRLAPDYSFNQIHVTAVVPVLALVLIGAAVIAAACSFRKQGIAWVGVLLFFILISPVSNVLTIIGTIKADRFLYLPSLGFCVVAAAILARSGRYAVAITALIALACSAQTLVRNSIWHDERSLWTEAVARSPNSAKAQYNVGVQQLKAGENAAAVDSFTKAVGIETNFMLARLNLGVALIYAGAPDRALAFYNESQAMFETNADFYVNRGLANVYTGRRAAAADDFRRALELNPQMEDAGYNLQLLEKEDGSR